MERDVIECGSIMLHCGVEWYDSPGTMSRVDRGLLVPTELVANTLTV